MRSATPARPFLPIAAAIGALVLIGVLVGSTAGPAFADRHCSYAREDAFYARDLSAEAEKAPPAQCPAKMREALDRLRKARNGLQDCSCSYAEGPLSRWYKGRPPSGRETGTACRASARAINAISRKVLTEVEKCF